MAAHDKTKSQRKKSRRTGPTDWSEWEYWEIYDREVRSRIDRHGVEKFEYREVAGRSVPRTPGEDLSNVDHVGLGNLGDFEGEDIDGYNYGVPSSIEDVTILLQQSRLGSVPEDGNTPQTGSSPQTSLANTYQTSQPPIGLAASSINSANYSTNNPLPPYSPPNVQSQGYGRGGAAVYSTDLSPLTARGNQTAARSNSGIGRGQPGNDVLADPTGGWNTLDPGQYMSVNAAQRPQAPNAGVSYVTTSPPINITHQTQASPRPAVTFLPSTPNPSAPRNNTSYNQTGRANTSNRSGDRVIRPDNTNADIVSSDLAKEFKICNSKRFKRGYVFKVVWIEPKGQGQRPNSNREYVSISKAKYGEEAYASIRRFVIVRSFEGHSLCLPILTYGNQGTKKPGVKPLHHSIIYTSSESNNSTTPPLEVPGEAPLFHPPIYVQRTEPRHVLDVASRINYAKLYTVEHNVRVVFIGRIHEDWEDQFFATYNQVQAGEVVTQVSDNDNVKFEGGDSNRKDKRDKNGGGKRDVHENNRNYRY